MPSLKIDIITEIANSSLRDDAETLLGRNYLWSFRELPEGGFSALVLEGNPEPFLVSWSEDKWSCECSESGACVHLAALLLKVAATGKDDARFSVLTGNKGNPDISGDFEDLFAWDAPQPVVQKEQPRKKPVENPKEITLQPQSAPIESKLNPDTDLLFFTEPNHVVKKAVIVLGPSKEVKEALRIRVSDTVRAGITEGQTTAEAGFTDLRGATWTIRPALSALREDGELSPPRPWSEEGLPPPDFPASDEIRETLAGYIGTGDIFLTPDGRDWQYLQADSLRLRFDPLLSAADDDPLYEPVVELLCPGSARKIPGESAEIEGWQSNVSVVTGAVIVSGNGLLVLDRVNARAAHIEDLADSLWFLRLMLSRRVLSASDLRARLKGNNKVPENIHIVLPDLPDTLKVLKPILVLEISAQNNGTDLIPGWKYGRTIIDGRGRGDVVMDTTSGIPRPTGLRDREAEDAVLDAAEEILGPALAWRRGRYARLSGDPNVPLRLDAPLQDVLAEFGGPLMEAGVELRLEDRPVRRAVGLNIRAGRKGSALELNASMQPESNEFDEELNAKLEIELDSWLENGGLVRTGEAYFTLTGKALDQLNYLRDHGMEDSGFLSTSPDNLSLIDAVYSEIEADEKTAGELERRRDAYTRLTSEVSDDRTDFQAPPDTFTAELRPYQVQGYRWLMRLREEGLGGCLADDMGLGKTVQTLAYLSRLKTDIKLGPSLLVGPVVTLGNWEAEIRRFAPDITFHRYTGPAGKRYIPAQDSGIELIIVSYQTLRNDIDKFLDRDWDHIILDEAHYVKNAASRTFKAIRSLTAAHRISLTGTPMENHLDDLWSQMSFLNPGLLGSRNRFNDRFVHPVGEGEAAGEKSAAGRLADIIAPFILRRRKTEVLTELPPKDESIIRCEMTDEQRGAYESMRGLYRRQVTGLISSDGLAKSRIQIFTIISKLRLLAIHPPLAGESFAGIEGGKMAAMDRLLEEIMEEDHKTLIFSQFLGALDRAEATCRRNNWDFSRLTGSTKNREEPIQRFNEDAERRVFLLSLKAGGVGINLTAADYVMLLDPWWNPAVEAQAVDRAHRMGQTRPVMVYRFIATDTIEERVLALQEHKKGLIAGVLGDETGGSLNETEIMDLFE